MPRPTIRAFLLVLLVGASCTSGRTSVPPVTHSTRPNAPIASSESSSPPGWSVRTLSNGTVSVQVPSRWAFRPDPVPDLVEPVMLFVTGEPRLPPAKRVACGVTPPRGGALVWLYEFVFPPPPGFPASNAARVRRTTPRRPPHFSLGRAIPGALECSRRPAYNVGFRTAGRIFFAKVALGPQAPTTLRRTVLLLLDSLAVRPL